MKVFFDECTAMLDNTEADKRQSEFDIKPFFKLRRKEDPQRIIVIHQAPRGNCQRKLSQDGNS